MPLYVGPRRTLLGASAAAARYYIDATSGNDSNDGLSSGTAWQTISKVNGESFNAGESILFKRGETWREQLTVPSSGSSGNPITFKAYGTGNDPLLSGATDITTATYKWTASGGGTNEYYLELSGGGDPGINEPRELWLNTSTYLTAAAVGSLNDHEWDWGDGDALGYSTVYFRDDTDDPDVSGITLDATQRAYGIYLTGKPYISINDFELRHTGTAATTGKGIYAISSSDNLAVSGVTAKYQQIGIFLDASEDCTVRNSTFSYNRNRGLFTQNGVNRLIVTNCTADYNDNGAQGKGYDIESASNCAFNQCTAANNLLAGFDIDGGTGTVFNRCLANDNGDQGFDVTTSALNVTIQYCIAYGNGGYGVINQNTCTGMKVYNCSTYDNAKYNIRLSANDSEVKNCIMLDGGWNKELVVDNALTGISLSDNCYHDSDATTVCSYGGSDYTNDKAGWETASGETGSVWADPLYVTNGSDYHLQAGSPCRNVGADLSLTVDYDGVSVPQETNPAIGAYEYTG